MFVASAVRMENETALEEKRARFESEVARETARSGGSPQESSTDEVKHVREMIHADETRPLPVQKQPDWTLDDGYGPPSPCCCHHVYSHKD